MQKLFSDRDFWITGLTIAATLMLVSAAHFFLEMREVSVMQDRADETMRKNYPKLLWAFDAWDDCSKAKGKYAKTKYITREECDLAILYERDQRNHNDQLKEAFALRDSMIANH